MKVYKVESISGVDGKVVRKTEYRKSSGDKYVPPKNKSKLLNSFKKNPKKLEKKFTSRKLLKKSKTTVEINEHKPAEYVNRYFKDEFEKEKSNLFLK